MLFICAPTSILSTFENTSCQCCDQSAVGRHVIVGRSRPAVHGVARYACNIRPNTPRRSIGSPDASSRKHLLQPASRLECREVLCCPQQIRSQCLQLHRGDLLRQRGEDVVITSFSPHLISYFHTIIHYGQVAPNSATNPSLSTVRPQTHFIITTTNQFH